MIGALAEGIDHTLRRSGDPKLERPGVSRPHKLTVCRRLAGRMGVLEASWNAWQ